MTYNRDGSLIKVGDWVRIVNDETKLPIGVDLLGHRNSGDFEEVSQINRNSIATISAFWKKDRSDDALMRVEYKNSTWEIRDNNREYQLDQQLDQEEDLL